MQWLAVTGERPPIDPPTAKAYTEAGLPWFEYYGEDATALDGAQRLAGLKSVAEAGKQTGRMPLPENDSAKGMRTHAVRRNRSSRVREMTTPMDRH